MIQSILDNDLYKFSMQQAVLECFPSAIAEYEFTDRSGNSKYNQAFVDAFTKNLKDMQTLSLLEEEGVWLMKKCPWMKPWYLNYLSTYRFNPSEVKFGLQGDSKFRLSIKGPWHQTILWEVPLLALISETYFSVVDKDWITTDQQSRLEQKYKLLAGAEAKHMEFGTRRRRNFTSQDNVVKYLAGQPHFIGTSNLHLARKHNTTPLGTMAHEWIMAHSALISLLRANKFALLNWNRIYGGKLGIALTDTYGLQAFFDDFDDNLARVYDGVRQDSGDPSNFMDRVTTHYHKLGIDPASKTYVYSDGLTTDSAIEIKQRQVKQVGANNCIFGIGTHLTNDYRNSFGNKSSPLNIVIKLRQINGKPVVKLSESPGKATGDADALRIAKFFFTGIPLDARSSTEKPQEQYEEKNNRKVHHRNGFLFREEYEDGGVAVVKYYEEGKLHRVDGPALEFADGRKEYYKHGALHCETGPAVITATGVQQYFKQGVLHRLNGPAVIYPTHEEWWVEGKKIEAPADSLNRKNHLPQMKQCEIRITETDDVLTSVAEIKKIVKDGNKVNVIVIYQDRPESAQAVMKLTLDSLTDSVKIESYASLDEVKKCLVARVAPPEPAMIPTYTYCSTGCTP